ncbi:MAG: DUF2844 domain-containing protein [Nitrospirae bacterium]|nr:DUF2844 domain-containing protein [Nitrospirota bacterium]
MPIRPKILGFSILVSLLGLAAVPALAVLGEDQNSIESDRQRLSGERKPAREKNGYRLETLKSPSMTLEEYVDSNGTIFAVTWKGAGFPDFEKLFGKYFEEFQKGWVERRKDNRLRRVPIVMKTDHLVVETGGRRRSLMGRAFVPSLFPTGVTEKEIR